MMLFSWCSSGSCIFNVFCQTSCLKINQLGPEPDAYICIVLLLQRLLSHREALATLNVSMFDGTTPLMTAVRLELEGMVEDLLKYQVDVNATDNKGTLYLYRVAWKGLYILPTRRYASCGPVSIICVCLSQVGVLLKGIDGSSWFLARKLLSTYPTVCWKKNLVSKK